jgi:AmmeMemoRadiSam system radical SAM enzyme
MSFAGLKYVVTGSMWMICDLIHRDQALRRKYSIILWVVMTQENDQDALNSGMVPGDFPGRSSGYCIDPIEKKPLNHFLPGTPVLSFGTAGCNLTCKFCQNWDISKGREFDRLTDQAMPEAIARAAAEHGCRSVAFTYKDPVIFLEYAVDVA